MPCARSRHVTNWAGPGPAGQVQPSTFRIHNISTLSLFNAASCVDLIRGRFSLLPAWSMDAIGMDATRCSESSRDREERLLRRRERERARRAAETAEQRAHRLWQRRERDRARRALQSSERRERELQCMRATSHDRLAAETGEEREARLQQMRDCCYLCARYMPISTL